MLKPIPTPIPIQMPALAVVLSVGSGIINNDNNNIHVSSSSAAIGVVVAAIFLFLLCCGLRRRRVQRTLKPAYVPPPLILPLHSTSLGGSAFPSGMQYGSPYPQPYPPQQYNRTSEYPPTGPNAEVAPPPYVKEGAPLAGYTSGPPSGPPPPGIDTAYPSAYSPPPGPPPRAHISSNSADFNGGFRPPAS
ncbi:hypothetical protein B0H11DRAFT_2295203 [Mycena galericulata]|nr:hypothetical protein B0H11DRAFT_2295203 [Mycena galericulata]